MNIDKATTGAGLALVACAACCAPLIAPPITAAIAAGGVGLALVGQLGLALVVIAAGGLYLLSRRKAEPNVYKGGKEVDRQTGQTDPAVIEALLREAL